MSAGGHFIADLRIVLRGRDFRRLFATRLTSQASDGAFQVALASLFFFSPQRATTAVGVATAFGVAVLPYTLVGPFAGVLLDHWRRRHVLVVANLVRAALVLVVAALVLGNVVGPLLVVTALACLSINRFFLAGLGASLPHVVVPDELVMANAVSPTCGTIATIIGGAAAVGVRELFGAAGAANALILAIAAAGFLASGLLARRMDRDLLGPEGGQHLPWRDVAAAVRGVLGGLAAALVHLRDLPGPRHALLAIGTQRFAYGMTTVTTVLLSRNYFNASSDVEAGAALLAAMVGISGTGFLLAAVVTPMATRRMGPQGWIVACSAIAAAVEASFLVTLNLAMALAAAFILGLASQGAKICVDSIVQGEVEDEYRGRVMSFYDVVFNVAFVGAAALCAVVLPADGYSRPVFATIGGIYAATAVGYARACGLGGRRSHLDQPT